MADPIHTIAGLYPRLMRAMGHLREAVDESLDLTYNQYKTLLSLAHLGPCTLGTLSRDMGVAPSSASQMVDRLVSMGLVVRRTDPGDRRSVVVELSRTGAGLLDRVSEGIVRRYAHLLRNIGPSEQANLAGAIHTLVRILEKAIRQEERRD